VKKSKKPKEELSRIPTTSFERGFRILGAAFAGSSSYVSNWFSSALSKEESTSGLISTVQPIVNEMSRLKGTVQKLGQMISVLGEHNLPKEVVNLFQPLLNQSMILNWTEIRAQLVKEFGEQKLSELEVDTVPVGAASIGQVHRAVIKKTGEVLALKIQYPGVSDTIDSDLATINAIFTLARLKKGLPELKGVVKEVNEMMKREVDYCQEHKMINLFENALSKKEGYIIPSVFPKWSTSKVLAMSFESGETLTDAMIQTLDQSEKNLLCTNFLKLFFFELFGLGIVQSDPHFGNYLYRKSNLGSPSLVLLDFGSVRVFSKAFVENYKRMAKAALHQDMDVFLDRAQKLGLRINADSMGTELWDLAKVVITPFLDPKLTNIPQVDADLFNTQGYFKWANSSLGQRVSNLAWQKRFDFGLSSIPRELVFLDRKLAGIHSFLQKFSAEIDCRQLLLEALSQPTDFTLRDELMNAGSKGH
jgi:predicted unusual protein kinase regulating ubiquinone biosynthesis (AarF/ABC1/UbiB family)